MISVIIPVYNTDIKLVKRCVQQIVNQSYSDFEIVLVNDGSKEECKKQLDALEQSFEKVRVIHQINQGVSAARNTGIRFAKGEYLAFVDADDLISEDFLSSGMYYMDSYHLDMVIGSIQYEPNIHNLDIQGPKEFQIYEGNEIEVVKKSLLDFRLPDIEHNILGSPCARIFRKEKVKDVYFDKEVRICEDQLYNLYVLDRCQKVGVVPEYWYTYFQHDFSALHSIQGGLSFFPFYEKLFEYGRLEKDVCVQNFLFDKIVGFYSGLVRHTMKEETLSITDKIKKIREYRKMEMFAHSLKKLCPFSSEITNSHKLRAVFLKGRLDFLLIAYHCFIRSKKEGERE
ncbi:MAG: glycosyltransferase family 2 protein [Bacillota bacterium]|nr:glycosyltransferase family 2 protein [Bacillota bacterium]